MIARRPSVLSATVGPMIRRVALLVPFALLVGCSGGSSAPKATPTPAPTVAHVSLTSDDRYFFTMGCLAVSTAGIDADFPTPRSAAVREQVLKAAGEFGQVSDPDVNAAGRSLSGANNPARWGPVLADTLRFCVANGYHPPV